jgi:hypothetical protein
VMKMILSFFVLFVILIGVAVTTKPTEQQRSADVSDMASHPKTPKQLVSEHLSVNSKLTISGSLVFGDFTFKNTSPLDVKDISIRCNHYAASETLIDSSNRTIYDVVNANSTKTVRGINMGFIHSQAKKTGCEILNFEMSFPAAAK